MIDYQIDFQARFEPNATVHSSNNGRCLALAVKLAYNDEPSIRAITSGIWGFDRARFRFLAGGGTFGFIAVSDGFCLVAFRGTASLKDWEFNIQTLPIAGPAGEVHRGFLDAYRPVAADVLGHLRAVRTNQPVWIAGHSLGGAIARICACDLHLVQGIPVQGIYTFGQPRVGNHKFLEASGSALASRTFRYVNHDDIVPHVPPFLLGYRHELNRIYIDGQRQLNFEVDQEEQALDTGNLLRLAQGEAQNLAQHIEGKAEDIDDHFMESYLAALP